MAHKSAYSKVEKIMLADLMKQQKMNEKFIKLLPAIDGVVFKQFAEKEVESGFSIP